MEEIGGVKLLKEKQKCRVLGGKGAKVGKDETSWLIRGIPVVRGRDKRNGNIQTVCISPYCGRLYPSSISTGFRKLPG